MNNADLIAALKRLLHGQLLTPSESLEIISLVKQNTASSEIDKKLVERYFGKA